MSILDIILLVIVAFYVFVGFRSGFIFRIGSLFGNILGIILAGRFYELFAQKYLQQIPIGQFLAFGIVQIGTSLIVGLIFRIISKIFNLLAIIPGLKLINKTGGAVVGLIEVMLILSVLAFVAQTLGRYSPTMTQVLDNSLFVPYIARFGSLFRGLLPSVLSQSSPV